MALITLLTLALAAVPVATGWVTRLIINQLTEPASVSSAAALSLGAVLAALGLLATAGGAFRSYMTTELSRRISLRAQDNLFCAVNRYVGLKNFENPGFLDRLRLAVNEGRSGPSQVSETLLGLLGSVATIVGFLGSLLIISPVMAILVFSGAIPVFIAELKLSRQRAAMMQRLAAAQRKEVFYSHLMSNVQAAKEIRLFGIGNFLHGRMLRELSHMNTENQGMDRRQLHAQIGLSSLSALVSGGALVWVVINTRHGNLTVGDLALFVAAVAGVQNGLTMTVAQVMSIHQRLLLFENYMTIVNSEPDLRTTENRPAEPAGTIELKDVWFRYGPEHPWILQGVNLTIPYGTSVGVVGTNGTGKSTLVKLICRFYDPDKGAILWNGVDIRQIDPETLRHRISAVFQDFMCYDMTVTENIGLGDLDRRDDTEAIEGAAHRGGAHELVMALPRGFDTLISRIFFQDDGDSQGVMLSGGQSQRLAIARAMFRADRDLLILDEPVSALDAKAEHELHERLARYWKGRTRVLTSHRLGVMRHVDLVVVLHQGSIVEQGSHDELIKRAGRYADLFELQSADYDREWNS
ncbi:ABC transporter ATP-binding protein [Actinomadura sp. 7K534]|uniref:ABC transporter ATP-binding protein n=1 Tax=Actinomadura sp. 7K534 TaxID=2530366 RepID=UPI001044F130|nr:ABC transporter ATP-binding protein [Actinomadura sp. 7K534]TDB95826.1 ABC transporter ATP-binding protein [Actinomadura sp. 7K534]